jgi:hypothetical protein
MKKPVVNENESLRPFGQALARAINIPFPVSSQRPELHDLRIRCKKPIIGRLAEKGQQPSLEARELMYKSFIESSECLRQKYFPNIAVRFPPPAKAAEPNYSIADYEFGTIAEVLMSIRE